MEIVPGGASEVPGAAVADLDQIVGDATGSVDGGHSGGSSDPGENPAPGETQALLDDLSPAGAAGDGAVAVAIAELRVAVEAMGTQVAKDHARAAAREQAIDRLHQEVERLRAGETRLLLLPAVTDLRRIHHDLRIQARSVPESISRSQLARLLSSFAESVELALERCGVCVVRPEDGAGYDTARHQAVGFTPTRDADLHGTVAQVVSEGYADVETGRAAVPAQVHVYRAVPAAEDAVPGAEAATMRKGPLAGKQG